MNRFAIALASATALAAAFVAAAPVGAHAWTYQTDDGRATTDVQANREASACCLRSMAEWMRLGRSA